MNRREKILAIAVGLFVGLFVLYMAVDRLVLSDIKRLDQQEEKLLKVIKLEDRQLSSYQGRASRLEGLIDKTFGTDENLASERVRVRLDQLLKANELNISLKPVTGSKVQGQYREVGWAAIARGKIEQVVNFLYMLNDEPYLRRVDSLSLTPMHRSGQMEMKLRDLTLVSAEQKDRQLPPGQVAESTNPKDLDSEQRKQYDVIALRDPFRPYVKHVEPPKPPAPEPTPVAKNLSPSRLSRLRSSRWQLGPDSRRSTYATRPVGRAKCLSPAIPSQAEKSL